MVISIRRILFPTDFSDAAREAQQYAVAVAERWDAELHLLHVVPAVVPYPDAASPFTSEAEPILMVEVAEKQLNHELDAEWCKNHHYQMATVVGSAVEEILSYATENEIDLIVLGTHGRTGLSRLLIGSVAEKVVRLAKCPVLTVHPQSLSESADK